MIRITAIGNTSKKNRSNPKNRDIKPDNILFAVDGDLSTVKICDFGLAHRWHPKDKNKLCKDRCGTKTYMSPEQLSQIPYGKSVDLYAFGMVLYIL
jgi:serine/threonine protein kinase